ncbi:MAG: NnrS family protein [Rhodomicrobium sp.]
MATTAETLRAYRGPILFSYGFRPFFLSGAVWAATAMAIFIAMLQGGVRLPTVFSPIDWHVHELLYGYLPAIVAGFLLTAVPNWTGRMPVAGGPLAVLLLIWLVGRVAVSCSAWLGGITAAVIDLSFLVALGIVVGREILAGKNKNNLKVLILVALLGLGNLVFHLEVAEKGYSDYGKRMGIAAAILLIALIGGRIVPSFSRNWLAKHSPSNLPAPFGGFDLAAIASAAIALLVWIALPAAAPTAAACAIAGTLHAVRLARWKGYRTLAEPLVTILHIGYAFVPIGFLLTALAITLPGAIPSVAGVHAWTAGAIGIMTLAVMTRASLGHTGRQLTASPGVKTIYGAAGIAVLARLLAAFAIMPGLMLHLAASGWILAFGGFALSFGPLLWGRRS